MNLYCSEDCKNAFFELTIKKLAEKREKKNKYVIKKVSKKRSGENAIYLQKRLVFLSLPENQVCPITKEQTTEVHHKKGRIGKLFLDEKLWLAVSRKGHQWIEMNPEKAKELGYSLNRL
jgi:hypothetical protein